jgi:hypothetical protein
LRKRWLAQTFLHRNNLPSDEKFAQEARIRFPARPSMTIVAASTRRRGHSTIDIA